MILQALHEYYKRKSAIDPNIPSLGWASKAIPFIIVINQEGKFVALRDTREGEGKQKEAKEFFVPALGEMRTGIKANLLWDNAEYVLGANPRKRSDVPDHHAAFKKRIAELDANLLKQQPLKAVVEFLNTNPLEQIEKSNPARELWQEILRDEKASFSFTFHVEGCPGSTIFDSLSDLVSLDADGEEKDICLVSGTRGKIKRLHPAINGVVGANTMGAAIISFDKKPFCSYGKERNYNAPVCASAAFAYTTALNFMLRKKSQNKIRLSESTVVFWSLKSENGYDMEADFPLYFGFPPKDDDPDKGVQAVRNLFKAVESGKPIGDEGGQFFVLGLSPNMARISIRFWRTGRTISIGGNIYQHFKDIEIARHPKAIPYPSLMQLLNAIALENKSENLPPNLAGRVMEAILDGRPYPVTLLQQCLGRIRADVAKKDNVTRERAAILKAYLNRADRYYKNTKEKEIAVALDKENRNAGYCLGRVFALLEWIQEKAQPGVNSGLQERYYRAASSMPVSVFSRLFSMRTHHLEKLDPGVRVNLERELGEAMNLITDIPTILNLDDQARFALGYYHQRQYLFTPRADREKQNKI
jgi:CRISPR-associated protein Csd1